MASQDAPLCVRCQQPVVVNRAEYALFESMHWLCFHLEFEHLADPDEACGDPSCPWWHIEVYKSKLQAMGLDPRRVLDEAIMQRYNLGGS